MAAHDSGWLDHYLAPPWVGRTDAAEFPQAPAETYRAIRELRLEEVPWMCRLLWLRDVPNRLFGAGRKMRLAPDRGVLDSFVDHGFLILEEEPGREILLGGIGRLWRPIDHLPLDTLHAAEEFRGYTEPGQVKALFDIQVVEQRAGSRVVSEIRMAGTDAASHRAFCRYWGIIGGASGFIRRSALRAAARCLRGS